MGSGKKKRRSGRKQRMAEKVSMSFPAPEEEPSPRLSPLEMWRIYDHTPGLTPPSQIDLDALADEWYLAVDDTGHIPSF